MRSFLVLASGLTAFFAPIVAAVGEDKGNAAEDVTAQKPAIADASDADAPLQLERVIVTGEKLERTLQETFTSVAAWTPADIEGAAAVSIVDIFDRTANLSDNNYSFSIRGIPSSGFGTLGEGSDLATLLVDGVALDGRMYENGVFNTWDFAQIEVLRGPQSIGQGRNSLAGAVVGRTRDPSFKWEARARASIATENTSQLAAVAGGPVVPDWLAFRVSVDRQATDGSVTNVTRDATDWDSRDVTTARAKLLFQPTTWKGFSALASYSYTRADNGSPSYVYALDATRVWADLRSRRAYEDAAHNDHSINQTAALEINHTFANSWVFTAISSWYDYNDDGVRDSDNSAVPIGISYRNYDNDFFAQELRLLAKGETWKLLVGAYGNIVDKRWRVRGDMPYYIAPQMYAVYNTDSRTHNRVQNAAGFVSGEWLPFDRWTFSAGLRYDYERAENTIRQAVSIVRGIGDPNIDGFLEYEISKANNNSDGDSSIGVLLPTASVAYRWTEDVSTALSVTRGYRSGGVSINLARGQAAAFDPEYTWNYELSLRSAWLDKTLHVNANIYYVDWRDQQVGVALSDSTFDTQTTNAGRSTLYGGEIEVREKLNAEWTLWQSLGYSHTRFDDFLDNGTDYAGNQFPFSPQWTVGIGVSWKHAAGWFATASYNYTSNAYSDARNYRNLRLGDRHLISAKIGYSARNWSAYVFGKNLLDDFYMTSRWGASNSGTVSAGTVGAPRIIGLALEARW